MMNLIRTIAAAAFLIGCASSPPVQAQPRVETQADWQGVERIVAIGDLEGAYEKYLDMLRQAGLIDAQNNWIGGRTHLVQLGDIPDRGPNSRAIMQHLIQLERQAAAAGGRVHALIGNHEAMNVEGDLRYVHPGEYQAFADRRSARLQNQALTAAIRNMRANPPPGGLPEFDEAWRAQWRADHPYGYVEHRRAWAPTGELGRWVVGHNAVIRINDTLFVHGGIGPSFNSVDAVTLNNAIRAALNEQPIAGYEDIVTNQEGPLWYRGLSTRGEAETPNLEAVLQRHGVRRIVVGHTKVAPAVMPRFGGRVIVADIANPDGLADPHAFVEIVGDTVTAVHRGQRVPVVATTPAERCAYYSRIAALDPPNSPMLQRAVQCASAEGAAAEPETAQ